MIKNCILSKDGQFRYSLIRQWDVKLPIMVFVMLNPSTADHEKDDPTIRKCIGFAKKFGYGEIVVLNLFAHRATKPADLKTAGYPVGQNNDAMIKAYLRAGHALTVVCAWGANAKGLARVDEVLKLIKDSGHTPMTLRINTDGTPAHPLMLPYACELTPMETA